MRHFKRLIKTRFALAYEEVKIGELKKGDFFVVHDDSDEETIHEDGSTIYICLDEIFATEDGKRKINAWTLDALNSYWLYIKNEWDRRGMEHKPISEVLGCSDCLWSLCEKNFLKNENI